MFVRVRDIDPTSGLVFCTTERGNVTWFTPDDPTVWEPGRVAYVSNTGNVVLVEDSFWNVGNSVGEVTHADEDDAVIRLDGQPRSFPQRDPNPFEVGQLIEFVPGMGPGKLVGTDSDLEFSRRLDDFNVESLITRASENDVTMGQIGGADELKRRAENLVKVALDPENRLKSLGVKQIKGILFSGPSGTGKTFMAKALASVTDAAFYNISGPVIAGELVGQSERRLRDIFEHAARNGPAILFFDEIDSLYTQRGDGSNEHTNRLVGQFLALLDGYRPFEQVMVIATTNLPTALDDALLRPGRLGHKLVFHIPTAADRYQILQAQTKDMQFMHGHEPPLDDLAEKTGGWTAAELAHIWTEAGILAVLDGRRRLCLEDVYAALPLVDHTPQRSDRRDRDAQPT
jgi:transitional endoplasmic reticulum ATPase